MAQTKNVGTGATNFDITYSLSDGCTGEVSFTSDSDWLTLGSKTSTEQTVNVAQNDTYSSRTGNITPSYQGNACTDNIITVNQAGQTIDLCNSLSCDNCNGKQVTSNDTEFTVTWLTTAPSEVAVISSVEVNDTSSNITGSSVGTSSVKFYFAENLDYYNDKTLTANCTVKFSDNTECPNQNISFTQTHKTSTCSCDDFSLGGNPSDWEYNDTSSKDVTVTSSSCISNIAVTDSTHFSASVGSGKITITPKGENDSDDPYEETITVSYEANGSSCPVKTINVRQNTQNCVPTSCTCYIVGNATAATTASSSDTSAEVVWSYTAVTVSKSNTCKTTSAVTETSTSSTTVTFPTNDTCGEETRNGTFTWGGHKACGENACSDSDVTVEWEVKQAKGKPDSECTECTCDYITISNTAVTIGSKANDTTSVAYTLGECSGTWSATTTSDWLEVTSVGSGNINLKALSTNTSSTRTATVTVTLNGSACGGKTITVTQNVQNCDCSDFTITELPNRTINATGGTISAFTVTQTGTCKPGNTTVTVNNPKFTTGITGDYITISANANDSYENVNGTVTVQVNGESTCTSSTTVTLKGKDCLCSDLSVSTTSVTITAGSSDTVTITPSCTTLGNITVADGTIAEASRSDNTITITGKKSGTTTVTLEYTASGTSCTKTINVTVTCPNYTITPDGGSGTGGTVNFSVS